MLLRYDRRPSSAGAVWRRPVVSGALAAFTQRRGDRLVTALRSERRLGAVGLRCAVGPFLVVWTAIKATGEALNSMRQVLHDYKGNPTADAKQDRTQIKTMK